ncbi:hypothetical protein Q7P37_002835 [Cladosporium fusiforme]
MPRPHLTLYMDVVSPFAYMAFYMLRNSPVFKQCDIEYIPIFLGGVMQACGNTPPIRIKSESSHLSLPPSVPPTLTLPTPNPSPKLTPPLDKDKYINLDRSRSANLFSIPILSTPPPNFPPNTLPAQRALCTIQANHPSRLPAAIEALYNTFWVEGQAIGEPDIVAQGLERVFAKDEVRGIMESVSTPEVKGLLSANTAQALECGAFGLPWFVARDAEGREEGFFGFDRLGMVVDHLGLEREGGGRGFRALL